MSGQADARIPRLRWQCRRGLLELDCILLHYLEQHFTQASTREQDQFMQLLQQQDDQLLAWLLHEEVEPAPELGVIIRRLRQTSV